MNRIRISTICGIFHTTHIYGYHETHFFSCMQAAQKISLLKKRDAATMTPFAYAASPVQNASDFSIVRFNVERRLCLLVYFH